MKTTSASKLRGLPGLSRAQSHCSGTPRLAHSALQITDLTSGLSLSLRPAIGCDVPHEAVMKQDETHTTGSATSKGRGLWGRLTLHSVM